MGDLKQSHADHKKHTKIHDEALAVLKDDLQRFKVEVDTNLEKQTTEAVQQAKSTKVLEITVDKLQGSIVGDFSNIREQQRTDRASLQSDIQEARAAAARGAMNNDNSIQGVANEIAPLKQFRELMVERLHVEKFISLVRDWQAGHVPQITSAVKELEERSRKLQSLQARDHEVVGELQKATSAIRGHFKMFHAIAAGLDDKPMPGYNDPMSTTAEDNMRLQGNWSQQGRDEETTRLQQNWSTGREEDTRLPPISSGRGSATPQRS